MKVSVLMITYNHEKFIEEALFGVLQQHVDFDIEFIIANDCSTDNTHKLITKHITDNNNKRITINYVNHPKNIGMMSNFSFALNQCKGKYIALCEGDDYWTDPLKLQKQVNFLEINQDFNICYHKALVFNQESLEFEDSKSINEINKVTLVGDLANGNFMHTPTVIIRNNFELPRWFTECAFGDWVIYMLSVGTSKIMRIDETMAVYRVHINGVWSVQPESYRIRETIKTYRFLLFSKLFTEQTKLILKSKMNFYNRKLNIDKRVNFGKKQQTIHFIKYGKS